MPSTSVYFGGPNGHGHVQDGPQLVLARNSVNFVSGGGVLGMKIEISPSIELSEADSEYGRKQAVVIPSYCRTVYDVKQYLQSIIDLPARIHLKFGEFCLRDDQDVAIFTCFGESVLIIEATHQVNHHALDIFHNDHSSRISEEFSGIDISDSKPKRKTKSKRKGVQVNLESAPAAEPESLNGNNEDQEMNDLEHVVTTRTTRSQNSYSETPRSRLTKSAKRRLRKERVRERKLQQNGTEAGSPIKIDLPITDATTGVTEKSSRKGKTNRSQENSMDEVRKSPPQAPRSVEPQNKVNGYQFNSSTPLPSSASNSISTYATYSGNTTNEFTVPKPKKTKFTSTLETPLRNESEDELVSSSTKKPRPDTPYMPKSAKNPALARCTDKFNFSTSSSSYEGVSNSSQNVKPDTPNLPLVSKSPHYNYVDKNQLKQLSREMVRNLNLTTEDESAKAQEAKRKREELVQRLNQSLNDVKQQLSAAVAQTPNFDECEQMEVADNEKEKNGHGLDKETCDQELKALTTVKEIREGSVIAFKITQLNEDNCPVISPFKEARVKSVDGTFLHLEYLKTDSTGPTPFAVEGYELASTNNPDVIDFNWMITPKLVRPGSEATGEMNA